MKKTACLVLLLFSILCVRPPQSPALSGGQWTQSTVSVDATGAKVLNAAPLNYLLVVNKGDNTVYLKEDALPGAGEGVPIPAGGSYEPEYPPHGDIYLKSASGTQSVEIVKG